MRERERGERQKRRLKVKEKERESDKGDFVVRDNGLIALNLGNMEQKKVQSPLMAAEKCTEDPTHKDVGATVLLPK